MKKKKLYFPPALRNLSPEQAKKIIADHRNCSEEEAAKFLEALGHRRQPDDQNRNEPLDDDKEQKRKRSA